MVKITRNLLTCALLLGASFLSTSNASAALVDVLGSAKGFSVLTYNTNNTSDSAFQGGPIGVVNGDWKQSGGAQTNNQQATQVILSPGHTNSGPAVLTTVFNASLLNSAWTDAMNASAMLASLAPTQTFGAINSGMSITESAVGQYVFNISSINLNQSALTLSAPAGSSIVLNISGSITLNGGGSGHGLLLAGGLTSSDVIWNLTGASSSITTTGGGNANTIYGTILATGSNASVNLHPGGVVGEIIATTLTTSSGALSSVPQVPEVTPGSVIFGFLCLVMLVSSWRARKARACVA